MTIALHARPGRTPDEVEWVIPAGLLAFTGAVASAPELDEPLASGNVVGIDVRPGIVAITLGEGHTWRKDGADIRARLTASLARADEWVPKTVQTPDEVLADVVAHVLQGPTGQFIRSHGGDVEVARICDGVIEVRFQGACEHCPALGFTLQARLEGAVRALCPHLKQMRAA